MPRSAFDKCVIAVNEIRGMRCFEKESGTIPKTVSRDSIVNLIYCGGISLKTAEFVVKCGDSMEFAEMQRFYKNGALDKVIREMTGRVNNG